ncbi:glycosyltransferase family 4 protein [Pseudanabaena sp. FACHB-1998]|uniref:glycosyltransferase family 4 protein n=1 Tax=Pseudanabaena sp. FACHB-1998 TaxID=2692858 RepID=UPI00168014F1|nr:glycosyltransferase family 4 protein [Pseudanabaena sp. FACHB-1998]MBD2178201.1 glycosyltransferase family 4 protein [Pseudanabaena sp. FACHB-1998]
MGSNLTVLAITESSMGHKTSSVRMSKYFALSCIQVDVYCDNQDKEVLVRVINKLLSFRIPIKFIDDRNLDFFRIRAQLGYALLTRRLIDRKTKHKKYNVLYMHTQPLAFLALDVMKKIPTVVSIDMTNVQASIEGKHHKYNWTYSPNIFMEKLVYNHATKIITLTDWARNSVINDYGIHPDKVKHLPPGVDTKLVVFTNRENRSRQVPYNLLFIGGDFKRKGGEDVLDVFLKNFTDKAILHIVTSESVKCEHPNVRIYSNVQAYTPEWLDLYQQADAFVMPSYAEAFGLVFIEAMASGLPVIASKLVQTTEIVKDGETGFLIPAGDREALANKIQTLIDNPSLSLAMGKRARQIVESDFDSDKNFQVLESIFRELSAANKQ